MINWKVRIRNKQFWIAIIPMVLVLAHQVLKLFGVDIDFTDLSNQLINIVETVFVILGLIGIVNDPTTNSLADSKTAMTYKVPKKED